MTYSIFDGAGNLIDAFTERAAALNCLAWIAQAEPESAGGMFLIAQDDAGNTVDETIYASAVPTLGGAIAGAGLWLTVVLSRVSTRTP